MAIIGNLLLFLYADLGKKQYDEESSGHWRDLASRALLQKLTFGLFCPMHPANPADATSQEKHQWIQSQLQTLGLNAWLEPPEDEHLNEYLPEDKKRITWLTGFSGESAPALVTPTRTYLFVDGRFHLQVDDEVDARVVEAVKLSDAHPERSLTETLKTLASQTPDQPYRVGYYPFVFTPGRLSALQKALTTASNLVWVPLETHCLDTLWQDKPQRANGAAYLLPPEVSGETTAAKLARIRNDLKALGAEMLPITRLDEVAWLFNLRGSDIDYNPVVEAYGLLTAQTAALFIRPQVLTASVQSELEASGVTVYPYQAYVDTLTQTLAASPQTVLIDKGAVTLGTLHRVEAANAAVVLEPTPIAMAKALKNPVELAGMREANQKASLALIEHFGWLETALAQGLTPSEAELRDHLEGCYRAQPGYKDLSFPTIPGVGTNSAIIHYSHADPNQRLKPGMFYLLDSGCQIWGGTTDTTRTTVYGPPTPDQIEAYTTVLKAHIACASAKFPKGTAARHLDAVCRAPMYAQTHECPHGIGHGVGAFLNVHEGPNRISKLATLPLAPGMVTSIEPGVYYGGWGGIRLENLYEVVSVPSNPRQPEALWYGFESLTWVPFVKKLIDVTRLGPEERAWLNNYHAQILTRFTPGLSTPAFTWLKDQCQPV